MFSAHVQTISALYPTLAQAITLPENDHHLEGWGLEEAGNVHAQAALLPGEFVFSRLTPPLSHMAVSQVCG